MGGNTMQWKNFGIRHISGERDMFWSIQPCCHIQFDNATPLDSTMIKCYLIKNAFWNWMWQPQAVTNKVVLDTAVLVPLGVLLLHVVVDSGRRVADGPVVVRMSSAPSGWLGRSLRWPFGQTTCPTVLACWHNWWSSRKSD